MNQLTQHKVSLESTPQLLDKHKGKVLKQQRNIVIGAAGVVLFLILWKVNKLLSSYEGIDKIESPTAANTTPSKPSKAPLPSPIPVSPSSIPPPNAGPSKADLTPSAPPAALLNEDTLTKRAAAKNAELKKQE